MEEIITKEKFNDFYHKGLEFRLTDKGNHYCETLRTQYLIGNPMKDETLTILSTLLIHYANFSMKDFEEGEHLITEIKSSTLELDTDVVMGFLIKHGYMEKNPDWDPEKGAIIADAIEMALKK